MKKENVYILYRLLFLCDICNISWCTVFYLQLLKLYLSTWPPGEARSLRLKRVVQAAAYFPPAGRFPACRLHTGPVWWAGRWGAARSWAPCQSFQSEPNKIRNFNVKLNSFLDDYWPKHTLYWGKMLSSPIESPIPEFMYLKINN